MLNGVMVACFLVGAGYPPLKWWVGAVAVAVGAAIVVLSLVGFALKTIERRRRARGESGNSK